MHPSLRRTWEKQDVLDELQTALDVVDELKPPDELRVATYNAAVQMLTQRAQVVGSAVDLSALGLTAGH